MSSPSPPSSQRSRHASSRGSSSHTGSMYRWARDKVRLRSGQPVPRSPGLSPSSTSTASVDKIDTAAAVPWSKYLSDKIDSWSARYRHSRTASHTFRMMRAGEDEGRLDGLGQGSQVPLPSNISDPVPASAPEATKTPSSSSLSGGHALSAERISKDAAVRGDKQPTATPSIVAPDGELIAGPSLLTRKTSGGGDGPGENLGDPTSQQKSSGSATSMTQPLQPVLMPRVLETGEPMLKVTQKKVMQRIFRLDADRGQILWDSKKSNRVDLESIQEVRTGSSASSYRTSLSISSVHESRWLSIIYQARGQWKALHLIALTDESLDRWRNTLVALQNLRRSLMGGLGLLEQRQSLWLRQHWREADASQDEKLDFDEIVKLCRRLGIESSKRDLRNRFQEADALKRGYLDFADFQRFVKHLKRRPEVEEIFKTWADANMSQPADQLSDPSSCCIDRDAKGDCITHSISARNFRRFLSEEQQMFESDLDGNTEWLYDRYRCGSHELDLDGFTAFLMSADNSALANVSAAECGSDLKGADATDTISEGKEKPGSAPTSSTSENSLAGRSSSLQRASATTAEELLAAGAPSSPLITQDMSHPLCDYFISSSHNTYLVGGQWKGDSTVEGYIRALQQGARSVELDCWDGPSNTPQITHGRTLTSKVPFADVIAAIARYAFVASPYPLILSLEVHADVQQQDVMAQILRERLGGMLLSKRLDASEDELKVLPSPKDLMGKILVKTKNLTLQQPEKGRPEQLSTMDNDTLVLADAPSTSTDTTTESESDTFLANARELVRSVAKRSSTGKPKESKKEKVLMSASLASLLVYTVGVKHRGLSKRETYAVEHMISLSEKSALKYVRDKVAVEDLIKHNRTHLTRIYPSMSSIARLHASANFMPHHFWATGSQLIALNFQTMDLGTELNQAMFARNGRCGFVLKPEALRVKDVSKKSRERLRLAVDVTIISAQQLPRFKDYSRDKEKERDKEQNDDSDVIDPFVVATILTPLSWGHQPGSHDAGSATTWANARSQTTHASQEVEVLASKQDGQRRTSFGSASMLAGPPAGRVPSTPVASPGHLRASSAGSALPIPIPRTSGRPTTPSTSSLKSRSITDVGSATSTVVNGALIGPSVSPPLAPPLLRERSSSSTNTAASQRNSLFGTSTSRLRTRTVKGNGFNPVWRQKLSLTLEVPAGAETAELLEHLQHTRSETSHTQQSSSEGDRLESRDGGTYDLSLPQISRLCRGLLDLCFLRLEVCEEDSTGFSGSSSASSVGDAACLAAYTISLGALQPGYRHVPLYDSQLCQFLFSTLFVHTRIRVIGVESDEQAPNQKGFDGPSSFGKTSQVKAGSKEFENLAPLMRAASKRSQGKSS